MRITSLKDGKEFQTMTMGISSLRVRYGVFIDINRLSIVGKRVE